MYIHMDRNKLMTTCSTKEVVGEWNFNFLQSKAAQYEALTDIEIVYFDRVEYEKVMWEANTNKYKSNFEYYQQFKQFKNLNEHIMKRLWAITKQKKFWNKEIKDVSEDYNRLGRERRICYY